MSLTDLKGQSINYGVVHPAFVPFFVQMSYSGGFSPEAVLEGQSNSSCVANIAAGSVAVCVGSMLEDSAYTSSAAFMQLTSIDLVLITNKLESSIDLDWFLQPFSGDLWVSIVCFIFVNSLLYYWVENMFRKSEEYHAVEQADCSHRIYVYTKNVAKTLYYGVNGFFSMSPETEAKTLSGKVVNFTFIVVFLLVLTCYTSNLVVFLTTGSFAPIYHSFEAVIAHKLTVCIKQDYQSLYYKWVQKHYPDRDYDLDAYTLVRADTINRSLPFAEYQADSSYNLSNLMAGRCQVLVDGWDSYKQSYYFAQDLCPHLMTFDAQFKIKQYFGFYVTRTLYPYLSYNLRNLVENGTKRILMDGLNFNFYACDQANQAEQVNPIRLSQTLMIIYIVVGIWTLNLAYFLLKFTYRYYYKHDNTHKQSVGQPISRYRRRRSSVSNSLNRL